MTKSQVASTVADAPADPDLDFSEFQSEEYKTDRETLPWIQALNKADDIERAGFFISLENAEKLGFTPDENWTPFSVRFGNEEEKTEGYRTIAPSFAIVHTSELFMRLREGDDASLVPYDKAKYSMGGYACVTRYLLILLSRDNQPLHYTPVQFTAKGSVCGAMAGELKKVHNEINKLVGSQMGNRFFALWRNTFFLETVIKGEKKASSWVTSIKGHETIAGKSHFYGRDPEMKTLMETLFDQYKDFSKLTPKTEGPVEENPIDESLSEFEEDF